jgi:hypothetical protein
LEHLQQISAPNAIAQIRSHTKGFQFLIPLFHDRCTAHSPKHINNHSLPLRLIHPRYCAKSHQSQQYRLEDKLMKYFPAEIEKTQGFIKGFQSDIRTVAAHPLPEEGFCGMEVNGTRFTEKAEAGEAILAVCKANQSLEPVPLGSYRGFKMELAFDSFQKEYQVLLKGEMTHRVPIGTSAAGNIQRLDNALAGIPARLEKTEQQLDNLRSQQEAAQAELGKPFPQEAELAEKSARLAELDALLNMDDRENDDPDRERTTEKPSVLAELRDRAGRIPPMTHRDDEEVAL